MIPMIDPMMAESTMLLVVTPSLVGVVLALLAGVAAAVVGTRRALGAAATPRSPTPGPARRTQAAPLPA